MEKVFAGWHDSLVMNSGQRVTSLAQWQIRRAEMIQILISGLYGELPRQPAQTRYTLLHIGRAVRPSTANRHTYRIEVDGRSAFTLQLTLAPTATGVPVILNGDACWGYATQEVIETIVERGYAFAQFNRTEIVSDVAENGWQQSHCDALQGFAGGAIAAWAWGYQRAVDAILLIPQLDAQRIGIVGHSRGGKAALLAGALDERIAITAANNSGAAGAGSFMWQASGAETLGDLLDRFAFWLASDAGRFRDAGPALPFDQHFLKALVAPRALLCTEALQDLWANPQGSWLTHVAAQPAFDLWGTPQHNAIVFREGVHAHTLADWGTLLDFTDAVFHHADLPKCFSHCPYPDLPSAWTR
jgi:hypothetical protein